MEEVLATWTRYFGAWATARQARDIVVGVTAVDRSPDGVLAADADGAGRDASTSSASSSPAARRPAGPARRAMGVKGSFTF
jgi:hypothetical protein